VIDVNHAHPRIMSEITGVGDERVAEHRFRPLDRRRIARAGVSRGTGEAANVIAARVQMVGLGAGEQLNELVGGRSRRRGEPQRRTVTRLIELGDFLIEL